MRTDLATIDQTFADVIEREVDCPAITKDASARADNDARKTIAGFEVIDEAAREKSLDEARKARKAAVNAYMEHSDALGQKLVALGVTPLAMLPTPAWRNICRQSGLFFINTPNGDVMLHTAKPFEYIRDHTTKRTRVLDLAREWMGRRPWEDVLNDLTPNGEFKDGNSYPNINARIVLPVPPPDVCKTLMKVQTLKPKTAAVSDAVSFSEDLGSIIASGYNVHLERERIERERAEWNAKHDPVVYVDENNVTAIVAQFGDFPIEKEIVEKVAAADILPVEEKMTTLVTGIYAGQGITNEHLAQLMMAQRQSQLTQLGAAQAFFGR